ncbi:uncharacterized protein [Pyrus communis]|uniref:uncharacterized protein n=1 Tax=Pyrus communis TaxID=23211 RepID=UPI0035C22E35
MAFHTRSDSFPLRPHPIVQQVDEHLSRLTSSKATSTSSLSIYHNLSSLGDLYGCVDRLLQLPLTQQALAREQNEKWTTELLDGSLRLLDICSTAKDAVLQTKAYVQDLQSIIRRTRGGESGALTSEVNKYLRAPGRWLKSNDTETVAIISKLRDVKEITLAVLESLLSFISGSKSRPGSWSLVSKMIPTKKVACEEKTESNEFAQVDAALHKTSKFENAHNQLEKLELCIQDQEEGLESLFRQLIKTRVSLLNILNH